MSGNTSETRCVYLGCDREEKHWSHTVYEDKPIHIDNHPFRPAHVVSTAAPERVELTIDEKLVILMEECAEVIQAASKCLRFGFNREQEGYGFCRKRKLCKAEKAKAEYGK